MKYKDLKELYKDVQKSGDKFVYGALKTLIGEVDLERSRSKKFDEDKSLQSVLKRFIKDGKALYDAKGGEELLKEIEFYETLVPKKMTDEEIQAELDKNSFTALPDVMKYFSQFGQSVDMNRVRELFTA